MKKLLAILASIFYLSTDAQITFETKTSQVYFKSVQPTKNGGYIVFGSPYLIGMDSIGNTTWAKKYKAIGSSTGLTSLSPTKDGGYITVGAVDSLGAGSYDILLIKTDSAGNVAWSKTYGGASNDYAYTVQQTSDNGYMMAGKTNSFGTGNYDIYLIKTDSLGVIQWTKTYGGTSDKTFASAQQTKDGGYVICGYSGSIFLIKTNVNGDTLWTKYYFPSSGGDLSDGNCQQTIDGGYILCGNLAVNPSQFFSDVFYFKTDTNGMPVWSKNIHTSWGTCSNTYAYISQIKQFNDKGYMYYWRGSANCGGMGTPPYTLGGSYITKTDSLGNRIWGRNVDDYMDTYQTYDSGYVIATNIGGIPYIIKANKVLSTTCYHNNGFDSLQAVNIIAQKTAFVISSGGISFNAPIQPTNISVTFTNVCSSTVGIKDYVNQNNTDITLYPNPTQNNFTIETSTTEKQQLQLFDITGKQVLAQTIYGTTTIDASNLENGIYFVQLKNSNGVSTQKLVVQR